VRNKAVLPRSEQVRQRRAQRSRERVGRVAQRAIFTSELPAVVVRGGIGTPVVQRSKNRPRRSFSIPLDMPGTEMRMPALPIIRPGWRLLSGFLTIMFGILIYVMLTAPILEISAPQLNGIQRLTAEDFENVLHLSGMNIFFFDPQYAHALLEKSFPELSYIDIQVALPNKVMITVIERQPVLAWEHGKVKWIDSEGYIFPARGEPSTQLVYVTGDTTPPLIHEQTQQELSGDPGAEQSDEESIKGDQDILEKSDLHPRMEPRLLQVILKLNSLIPGVPLVYSGQNGLGWKDPAGWQVFIGTSLEQFDEKMTVYQAIVKKLNEQGIQPAMISVEHIHAPFYRMEP
jgi:hypothetical protein